MYGNSHGSLEFPIGSAASMLSIDDLIPFIDANFRSLADQPDRAMAGLSMGSLISRPQEMNGSGSKINPAAWRRRQAFGFGP